MRAKVDILTISYRETGGALHAAIFALPIGQGSDMRTQLIGAGAREGASAGQELKERTRRDWRHQHTREFRFAIYERLVERIRHDGTFQKVFRSGDLEAANVPGLVTLRTKVGKFKEGSQLRRELTTVSGGTTVGVTNDLAKRIAKLLRERL